MDILKKCLNPLTKQFLYNVHISVKTRPRDILSRTYLTRIKMPRPQPAPRQLAPATAAAAAAAITTAIGIPWRSALPSCCVPVTPQQRISSIVKRLHRRPKLQLVLQQFLRMEVQRPLRQPRRRRPVHRVSTTRRNLHL